MKNYKFKTKNISVSRLNNNGYRNVCYIEILPYESELTLQKVKRYINSIKKKIKEDFVLYLEGFCVDGLTETNNLLVNKGSILTNKLTNNYITL